MPISRRQFVLRTTGVAAGGLAGWPILDANGLAIATADAATNALPKHSAERFYKRLPNGNVVCLICPRKCELKPDERSFCRTRSNHNGHLVTYAYANPAVVSVDEMAKFPLAHFRPDKTALTIAVGGCNLRCKYCQNAKEAQPRPEDLKTFPLPLSKAAAAVRDKGFDTLAFTYTGPIASLEYVLDMCDTAKEAGLRTVIGSGMYVNPRPLRELCKVTDAFQPFCPVVPA